MFRATIFAHLQEHQTV